MPNLVLSVSRIRSRVAVVARRLPLLNYFSYLRAYDVPANSPTSRKPGTSTRHVPRSESLAGRIPHWLKRGGVAFDAAFPSAVRPCKDPRSFAANSIAPYSQAAPQGTSFHKAKESNCTSKSVRKRFVRRRIPHTGRSSGASRNVRICGMRWEMYSDDVPCDVAGLGLTRSAACKLQPHDKKTC
jgi:hypothetical protein